MLALSEQSDRVVADLDNGSRDSGVALVPSVGFLNTMATTAVRGQGGKPKAGAWPPSSINCLSLATAFSKS